MRLHSSMLCPTKLEVRDYEAPFADLEREAYVVKKRACYRNILHWLKDFKVIVPTISNYNSKTDWDVPAKRIFSDGGVSLNLGEENAR